jgi:hypothetical protein
MAYDLSNLLTLKSLVFTLLLPNLGNLIIVHILPIPTERAQNLVAGRETVQRKHDGLGARRCLHPPLRITPNDDRKIIRGHLATQSSKDRWSISILILIVTNFTTLTRLYLFISL